ncbi:uncharacterized protein JCM15063_002968 [Sporobolomyces koalae]|uniref:uncharacterized protein n=1 Tax=Sporobolomyces koalae TaxID=500713 RepID=UPI00317E8026
MPLSPDAITPLTSLSSINSFDDDDQHVPQRDLEPLLPQYFDPDKARSSRSKRNCTRDQLVCRVGLGLVTGLAVFAVVCWLWETYLASVDLRPLDSWMRAASAEEPLAATLRFLRNASTVNQGTIPFSSSDFSPLYTATRPYSTLSTSSFPSTACSEAYIAHGELCDELAGRWSRQEDQPKLDLIWTWTNGSRSEVMSSWKEKVSQEVGLIGWSKRAAIRSLVTRAYHLMGATVYKHFREHDELRFSIRSTLASLTSASVATLHLVTGDTPSLPADVVRQEPWLRSAQVPQWLDLSSVGFASSSMGSRSSPVFRVHPHSEIFKTQTPTQEEARAWQNSVLPSFNSLAIESQLANLDTDSKSAVYLNDDFFLNKPLSVSDIESPLTGPVFRMQRDLLVAGVDSTNQDTDPESEWKGLGFAGHLLDRRFGTRKRPYLVHVAKSVSLPLLKEMHSVFMTDLTRTAEARFRGKGLIEAQTMHLFVHYTIEKHREALLWSFLIGRSNSNGTGSYSVADRSRIMVDLELDFDAPNQKSLVPVQAPARASLEALNKHYPQTGLPALRETEVRFLSADGYALFDLENQNFAQAGPAQRDWPSFNPTRDTPLPESIGSEQDANQVGEPVCLLDLDSCFGTDFFDLSNANLVSAQDTFKRIAFEQPRCGDCLIVKLMSQSGEKGLEAFVPHPEDAGSSQAPNSVAVVGTTGTSWQDVDFNREQVSNETVRDFAISLIQRYSYAVGESSAAFRSIRGGGQALSNMLESLSEPTDYSEPPAFIALNDDIGSSRPSVLATTDKRLGEWFRKVWPNRSPWEYSRD